MLETNPKRESSTGSLNPGRWFGYYAGYSRRFVQDTIEFLRLRPDDPVLDPWNGSGTTTEVLHEAGLVGKGFDINPAMVLVAKARLLRSDVTPSHLSLCDTILGSTKQAESVLPEEPLSVWFSPSSAAALRRIECSIQRVLIPGGYQRLAASATLGHVSPLAAFFYVALFRTIRQFLGAFVASNPTWIKDPASSSARLRPSTGTLHEAFRSEVSLMFDSAGPFHARPATTRAHVEIGDSMSLSLENGWAMAVIGSPPYCTRIDYAVATKPELAALGMTSAEFRTLRSRMVGTPLVVDGSLEPDKRWGETCARFLERVRRHYSRASKGYYFKNHLQYYRCLFASVSEIDRVLRRPDGRAVLVVQDSHYKDVHNDLPRITAEMLSHFGFGLVARRDHYLTRTKAAVNTRSHKYRTKSDATESVLLFERRAKGDSCSMSR